jgi:hypothetical protein
MFFAGVVSYAFLIRILDIRSKAILYKLTLVNCLSILKYTSKCVEASLLETQDYGKEHTKTIMQYWQEVAVVSLKNSIPDETWRTLSVDDWKQAMRLLSQIEHLGGE